MTADADVKAVAAFILPAPVAPRVWGLTPAERHRRALSKLGVGQVLGPGSPWPARGTVLLLRGDTVYDGAVLEGLLRRPASLVSHDGTGGGRPAAAHVDAADAAAARAWLEGRGPPPAGAAVHDAAGIGEAYRGRLRKRERPYCLAVDGDTRAVERHLYTAAYKGVTDLVTKYAWPVPAMWATRACVRLGLTPNAVTAASAVLVLLALWLFWQGTYGWGLLAAWVMTFLDTVDGKLARVTLTSSPFGNVFDHGIDLVHPPFWYAAWGLGLAGAGAALPPGWLPPVLVAVFAGYVLGRLCEGYFLRRFGVEIHVWRRFDSVFRLVTARRNPNLILLTMGWAAGRPELGLLAVAAWTAASLAVHLVRIAQAEARRARGGAIASWLWMSA